MAITAADVMQRATVILQDDGAVRWPATELLKWLNDGQREIALIKPTAVTDTVEIELDTGSRQELAGSHLSLIRVHRNLANRDADVGGRTGGRAIRAIERSVLDNQLPGWSDPSVLPHSATVDHIVYDDTNPREFFVVPGNDGTGVIEATVALIPDDIAEPSNPLQIESYTAALAIPEIWRGALTDYVLYRAYSKDSQSPNAGNRAVMHYQQFQQALGVKIATDQALNPDRAGA